MPQDYTSLLVSNTDGWHDGDGIITYNFIGTEMPNYYPAVDSNNDGENDAWDVSGDGLLVPFQGHERVGHWQNLVRDRRFEDLAHELMALHYDRRYDKSRKAAQPGQVSVLELDKVASPDLEAAADRLLRMIG